MQAEINKTKHKAAKALSEGSRRFSQHSNARSISLLKNRSRELLSG
jgi:hypothetical protein